MRAAVPLAVALFSTHNAPTAHDLDLQVFGGTLAMTIVASKFCPKFQVDKTLVAALARSAFFDKLKDGPVVNAATHAAVDALMAGLRRAASVPGWRDEVYRLHGPGGRMVPYGERRSVRQPRHPEFWPRQRQISN